MAAMTTYLRDKILDHVLNGVTYSPPAGLWLGLFTSATDAAGSGTEVSGGGYARQPVTFTTPSSGMANNSTDIFFPTDASGWGTIGWVAILDAVTAGNMLYYAKLSVPVYSNIGNTFSKNAGSVVIALK